VPLLLTDFYLTVLHVNRPIVHLVHALSARPFAATALSTSA